MYLQDVLQKMLIFNIFRIVYLVLNMGTNEYAIGFISPQNAQPVLIQSAYG